MTKLYGVLWRWHFLVGIVTFPVLFVVAITGAIYTFQPELDRIASRELLVVEPQATRASLDVLIARATETCTARGILVPRERHRSVIAFCDQDREAYLDPYSARTLGVRRMKSSFFGVIFDLHYELALGTPGRLAIEWACSWAVLLVISGVVLWWPRGRRRAAGVWWPRRRVSARQVLRDLHAVAGAYLLPILLALTATGLTWTLHAGDQRWRPAIREAALAEPRSIVQPTPPIGFEAAYDIVRASRDASELAIYVGTVAKADEPYAFLIYDESWVRPWRSWSAWVDMYSGKLLREVGWDEHSAAGKINETVYPIHIGTIGGLPGRIAACLGSLVLALLCVTGPWMWWKRRRRGELGIPVAKRRAPWPLLIALVACGWLLPLVGWTLVGIAVVEAIRWIRSRR